MSVVTPIMIEEQEQERRLQAAMEKALDFSEIHASVERAERLLEMAKRLLERDAPSVDPRTADERAMDEWAAEWQATYNDLRNSM